MSKIIFLLTFCVLFATLIFFYCFEIVPFEITHNHKSLYMDKFHFEEAFDRLKSENITRVNDIKGLIVNHHILASHLIAKTFLSVEQKPATVILISPNHFNVGLGKLQTSLSDWETPYGILQTDQALTKELIATGAATKEGEVFKKEHGVSGVVPFIKKLFPKTKIVILVVKDSLTKDDADWVTTKLLPLIKPDTLVVGSFDFSHDSTPNIAEIRDKRSLENLISRKYEELFEEVSVDSKPGLYILSKLMADKKYKFQVLENTNSARLTKNPTQHDTTSYIVGYYK